MLVSILDEHNISNKFLILACWKLQRFISLKPNLWYRWLNRRHAVLFIFVLGILSKMSSKKGLILCVTCNTNFKTFAALQDHQLSRKHHLAVHNAYMEEMKEKCGLFITGIPNATFTVWFVHTIGRYLFLSYGDCLSSSGYSSLLACSRVKE